MVNKPYKSVLQYFNDHPKSSYYNGISKNDFMSLRYEDIERYFTVGGKKSLFNYISSIQSNTENYFKNEIKGKFRIKHTFAVYLLGIILYDKSIFVGECINKCVKKMMKMEHRNVNLEDIEPNELRSHFLYVWYLICLCHDLGTPIEEESKKAEDIEKYINIFKKMLYSIYD